MRLLKFNEAYKDRPMTDEDMEVVEDCFYHLIEDWDLKTKYVPKQNPTPSRPRSIEDRKYGFDDDNRFTGDYYMSLDNRHMGSVHLSIRMPHLKGNDLEKFLKGLDIFYRRLKSQGMSECSGKDLGKRSWANIYPTEVRSLFKISQTAVRKWDIHISWSPYKKWKESELQNVKTFNESVEEKPYYKIGILDWAPLLGGDYFGSNIVKFNQREKNEIITYYNQFYDPDFTLIWYDVGEDIDKYHQFTIVRPDGRYHFVKTEDDWIGVYYIPKSYGRHPNLINLGEIKYWKCDQVSGLKKFIFDIQYYKVEGF